MSDYAPLKKELCTHIKNTINIHYICGSSNKTNKGSKKRKKNQGSQTSFILK